MSILESVIWKLGQKGYGEREKTKSKEQKQKNKDSLVYGFDKWMSCNRGSRGAVQEEHSLMRSTFALGYTELVKCPVAEVQTVSKYLDSGLFSVINHTLG